jgi:hypothetical protein
MLKADQATAIVKFKTQTESKDFTEHDFEQLIFNALKDSINIDSVVVRLKKQE